MCSVEPSKVKSEQLLSGSATKYWNLGNTELSSSSRGLGLPDLPHLVFQDIREQLLEGDGVLEDLEESMLGVLQGGLPSPGLVRGSPGLHLHRLALHKVHHQGIFLKPGGDVVMLHLLHDS